MNNFLNLLALTFIVQNQNRILLTILGKVSNSWYTFLIYFFGVSGGSQLGVARDCKDLYPGDLSNGTQIVYNVPHNALDLLDVVIIGGIIFIFLLSVKYYDKLRVSSSALPLVGLGIGEPKSAELGDDLVSFFFSTYGFNPDYTTISYFILISALIALVLLILPLVLKPSTPSFEKNSSYECGFEPFVCKNESFESHFLIVGVLFLLFDLELIFLFPLVAIPTTVDLLVLVAVIPFLVILFFGFLFEWVRGALLWPIFYSKRENIF